MKSANQGEKIRGSYFITGLVLSAGLALTFITAQGIHRQAHEQATLAQQSQANMLGLRVGKKFTSFEQLLNSAKVLLQSTSRSREDSWESFTAKLKLKKNYPGAVFIGYSELTGANTDDRLQTTTRSIKPVQNSNRHLLGSDLSRFPKQREAMIRARDFGKISDTGRMDLSQFVGINSAAGMVIYMPIYDGMQAIDWIAQRRAKLHGFVYLVVDVAELVRITITSANVDLPVLRLFDGPANETGKLVEEFIGETKGDPLSTYESKLTFADRPWTVNITAPAHSELAHNELAYGVKFGGSALSILLALTAWFQVAGRRREHQLVTLNEQLAWTQRRAEQANLAKSAFLATMSHEIRTPMNGVIGMLDVLAATKVSPEQHGMIQTVRQSGLSLLKLIDDILDFSKIESEMLYIERIQFELEPLVRETGHSLFAIAADKQVSLSIFVDPRLPMRVWADPTRLKQILFNLTGNAIKFSSKNIDHSGRVSLRFSPDSQSDDCVLIEVIDNGIGMTGETIETLFDAFTQAEISTTRRFGGSGLGLAISKRLIDMAGGSIHVSSRLHEGSKFAVRLPMLESDTAEREKMVDLSSVTCLMVNSAAYSHADLATYLACAGAQTVQVENATQIDDRLLRQRGKTTLVIGIAEDLSDKLAVTSNPESSIDQSVHVVIWRASSLAATPKHGDNSSEPAPASVSLAPLELLPTSFVKWAAHVAGLIQFDTDKQEISPPVHETPFDDTPETLRQQTRARILVAEDEPVNQQVIARQLKLLGYDSKIASNGIEALQFYKADHYDLLLTDLHMPGMDGYELTRAIRSSEANKASTPVLMLSANAISGESALATSVGVDEYLTKPIQLDTLRLALNKWLADQLTTTADDATQLNDGQLADTGTILDLEVLHKLVEGDEDIARSITLEFQRSIRQAHSELAEAQAASNKSQIREIAHRIKSSARSVGALDLGEICAALETAAQDPENSTLESMLQAFTAAASDVDRKIDEHLAQPVAP